MPPLLALALALLAGGLVGLWVPMPPLAVAAALLAASALWLGLPRRPGPALVTFLAAGLLAGSLRASGAEPGPQAGGWSLAGRVIAAPLPLGPGCQVDVDQVVARRRERWVEATTLGPLMLRGPCPALAPGDRVRWTGPPPEVGPKGMGAPVWRARADSLVRVGGGPAPGWTLGRLGHAALARVEPWRDPGRALVAAVLLGRRDWLDGADRAALRISGTAHLMAISGLHVGLVSALIFFAVRRAGALVPALCRRVAAPRLAAAFSLGGTWGFVLLCGAAPSAVRAGFMVTAWLLGLLTWRRPDPWASFALAVIGVTLWDPAHWALPGCQLSFAAVAGLIAAGRGADRHPMYQLASEAEPRGRLLVRLVDLLRATTVATVATLPLSAHHFGQVSAVGLVANLFAVPVMCSAVVPLGLVGLILAFPFPWAGAPVIALAASIADGVVGASDLVAAWLAPMMSFPLRPSVAQVVAAYALLAALALRRLRRLALFLGLGAVAISLLAFGLGRLGPGGGAALRVELLDVGDGDAILISLPDGRHGLMDAPGTGDPEGFAERRLADGLLRRGVRRLDFVVATHGHADHVGGLPAVLRAMPVRVIWYRGAGASGPEWAPLWTAARRAGTPMEPIRAARFGPVRLEVLAPALPNRDARSEAASLTLGENDLSIVLRLVHPAGAVLLAGDLERAGEEALLGRGAPLGATVLKVAHHGSRSATSDALLGAVEPAVAVITAAAPRPGRPSPLPNLSRRLRARGTVPLVTGLEGDVTVTFAPWGITVDTASGLRLRLPPEQVPFLPGGLPRSVPLGSALGLLGPP